MEPVKAQTDFEQAIVALAHDLPKMAIKDACTRLDWLRRQATLEGFVPAAMLADGFANAITKQGRNAPVRSWLDALSMAASCGRDNADAGPLLLATVGVRFEV
jgi:hypothetical protein